MSGACTWIGSGQAIEACCKPTVFGKSYCEDHIWRVYQKGTSIGNKRQLQAMEKELKELKRIQEIQEIENE
jgi:hypothetical protein